MRIPLGYGFTIWRECGVCLAEKMYQELQVKVKKEGERDMRFSGEWLMTRPTYFENFKPFQNWQKTNTKKIETILFKKFKKF